MRHVYFVLMYSLLLGCTPFRSQIASFPDPALEGKRYSLLVVKVNSGDLLLCKTLEGALVNSGFFAKSNVESFLRIAPPTRERTPEEIHLRLKERGTQALLVFDMDTTGVTRVYLPAQTALTTTKTTEWLEDSAWKEVKREETVQNQTHERAQYAEHPWFPCKVSVYDFETNERMWMALIDIREYSRSMDIQEVCRQIANRIWYALKDDGVVE